MAKNNDAGVLLFFGRQVSIAIGVQKAEDLDERILAAVVFKCLDVNAGSIFFTEPINELDFRVHSIIVANETPDETDDNDGRS